MIKKIQCRVLLILALLCACTPFELFYSQQKSTLGLSSSPCRKLKQRAPVGTLERKSFLTKQILTPSDQAYHFEFELNESFDVNRHMLLNVRQNKPLIQVLKVRVNGQQVSSYLSDSSLLNPETPDMVSNLCTLVQAGKNTLDVEIKGEADGKVELFLDGFLPTIDIEKSLHSHESPKVNNNTFKGVIYIKFLEGMKVRLDTSKPLADQLTDLTGISLQPLRLFIQQFGIRHIELTHKGTPEEHDLNEKNSETEGLRNQFYYPNYNLAYKLTFDSSKDLNVMVKVLIGMPFFEGIGTDDGGAFLVPANY